MLYSVSEWDFYWWDLSQKIFDLYLGVKWWMVDLAWSWMVALRRMPKQNLCWIGMFQMAWLEGKYQVSIKFAKSYVITKTSIWIPCLGSSSTDHVKLWILNICFWFWFFPLRLPAENNIKYSIFKIWHFQINELQKTYVNTKIRSMHIINYLCESSGSASASGYG